MSRKSSFSLIGACLAIVFEVGAACFAGRSCFAIELHVDEITSRAAKNSELVQAQARMVESDQLREKGASLLPNPHLNVQSGSLSSAGVSGLVLETIASQTFPFPGKLSAARQNLQIQRELTELEGAVLAQRLEHEALVATVRLKALTEMALHSEERRHHFKLIRDYLKTHPLRSPKLKAESALLENQMRLIEKGIAELEREVQRAQRDLQFLLQTHETIAPLLDWVLAPRIPEKEPLRKEVIEKNFASKRSHLEVRLAETILKRTRLTPWPDFQLGLSYRKENVVPSNTFYTGMLTVSLPIIDRGQYSAPAAELRLESERLKLEHEQRQVIRSFEEQYQQVTIAARILKSFSPKLIQPTEEQFLEMENQFRKNRINTPIFLQLDSQVHETMDSIFQAQVHYVESVSLLYRMSGRSVRWSEL